MVKKIKVKCTSAIETTFEPFPYEAVFRQTDEKKYRGGEIQQIKIRSDRPLTAYEVGKAYTIEIKSVE